MVDVVLRRDKAKRNPSLCLEIPCQSVRTVTLLLSASPLLCFCLQNLRNNPYLFRICCSGAAYVPTPILSRYPEATVITTSEQMPNMSLTASPRVPLEVGERVASALLEAGESEVGREMLAAINVNAFEAADKREYAGLEKLLHGMWGY